MVIINTAPLDDSLHTAYNPIPFSVMALDSSSNVPPIVYADIYITGVYYGTITSTTYLYMTGPYGVFEFDIQDKMQEYLRSTYVYDANNGSDMTLHSARVEVYFRDAEYDADGLLTSLYTAPIAGDFYNEPVAGDGEYSTSFIVMNGHLRRQDYPLTETHLTAICPQGASAFLFGYNLSHRPNRHTPYSFKYGGGNYYVGRKDVDILCFYTITPLITVTAFVNVAVVYKNGTTANQTKLISTLPFGGMTNSYNTHWMNAGYDFLRAQFSSLTWADVVEYTVKVGDVFKDYCIQRYVINDFTCVDRVRIFFQNILGGFDGINFLLEEAVSKTESETYQRSYPYIFFPSQKSRGLNRMQPSQVNVIECYSEEYAEEDLPWLEELLGTTQAFVQEDGRANGLVTTVNIYSIMILDGEIVKKKKDDRFVYTVTIKWTYSNPVLNLRN